MNSKIVRKEQYLIRSKQQQIYTVKQNKVALNVDNINEFKRYIVKDDKDYDTLAYGHYKIDSQII